MGPEKRGAGRSGRTAANGRTAEVVRKTRETEVSLRVDLDRPAPPRISTGIGFFDHMLTALAVHGRLGLEVEARGDLHVDAHHLVEDVGIALGAALREALGEDLRIRRFAHAYAPLDDALARAVVDASGRGYLHYDAEFRRARVGGFEVDLAEEFFRALSANARLNLHLTVLHGRNAHHQLEALFKALALALRDALALDPTLRAVPSTKGALSEAAARRRPAAGPSPEGPSPEGPSPGGTAGSPAEDEVGPAGEGHDDSPVPEEPGQSMPGRPEEADLDGAPPRKRRGTRRAGRSR